MTSSKDGGPELFRTLFNAIPSLILVVDRDMKVVQYNDAVDRLLNNSGETLLRRRGGDLLDCLHSRETSQGCGRAPACRKCVIRNSVEEAFSGNRVVRRRTRMELIRENAVTELYALITASPFSFNDSQLVLLVIEDINEIAELRRMIPICAVCKKIRDEKESWSQVENYFREHWDVDFSHGLCPDCYSREIKKIKNS